MGRGDRLQVSRRRGSCPGRRGPGRSIPTQADANVAYKGQALAHLDDGATASVAIQRLIEDDPGRDHRQVGVVDGDGGAASHTGRHASTGPWLTGDGYAIQGNVLTGEEVVLAMQAAWEDSGSDTPLAHRLLAALAAGDDARGDRRGRQSAALLVVREEAGQGASTTSRSTCGSTTTPRRSRAGTAAGPQRPLPDSVHRGREGAGHAEIGGARGVRRSAATATSSLGGTRTTRCGSTPTSRGSTGGSSRSSGPRNERARDDAGTTGVTAVVVTPRRTVPAYGYQEFAQHFPKPGWVEHAPEEI